MSWRRSRVHRSLRRVGARLERCRRDLRVATEQALVLVDEHDDLAVRAMVSESAYDRSEAHAASGPAEALARERDRLAREIADLEAVQDRLLDELRSLG